MEEEKNEQQPVVASAEDAVEAVEATVEEVATEANAAEMSEAEASAVEQGAAEAAEAAEDVVAEAAEAVEEAEDAAAEATEAVEDAAAEVVAEEATEQKPADKAVGAASAPEDESEAEEESAGIGNIIAVGIIALIFGLLLCLPTFLSSADSSSNYDLSGGVAATVGNTKIGENDVTNYITKFRNIQNLNEEDAWGNWLVEYGYDPETLRATSIEQFVTRELVKQAGASEGIEISDEAVEEQYNQIIAQFENEEAFEAELEAEGLTAEELKESIELSLIEEALTDKVVTTDVTPTDEDVLMILKLYYPDQVSEDAESLDGVDKDLVDYVRDALQSQTRSEAFSNWMNQFREKVGVEVADMPEGLPYAVDITLYQNTDTDGEMLDVEDEGEELVVETTESDKE